MKILLTGAFGYTDEQKKLIKDLGFNVIFQQQEKDITENCHEFDAVICNGLFLHNPIENFQNLKYIQLTSAGYDRVPMEYVKERGIEIHNAQGVYNIPIAEHTVLKILEIYKKSRQFYENQKAHNWEKERNILELFGKNIAIVGCGNIGRTIARLLKGFGVKITAVDIFEVSDENVDVYRHIDELSSVLAESDIVVVTLPLTEETCGLFDKASFSQMKNTSILVNVSRGAVINQKHLEDALLGGEIMGAALDVFSEEPLDGHSKLWDIPNVVITPHNSFVGENNPKRMFDVIYKNLKEWVSK